MNKICRHTYSDFVVQLAVELYLFTNCGFEKISGLIEYLNNFLGLELDRIPCANSIENWVKKMGYHIYRQSPKSFSKKKYATIIDESMMLGSEKMLLTLGVAAEKRDNKSLQHKDIKVLDISVAEKWNSDTVSDKLQETEKKVGHSPVYSISDNDSKLCKSLREEGYTQIRDIGHTMARLIEQVYGKEEDYKIYSKQLSQVKVREVMRPSSYLLPPRQRTIARFMNLSPILKWSKQIGNNFSKLNKEEAKNFRFVKKYFPLVEELEQIFSCVNSILKQAKEQGFSKKKINRYIREIDHKLIHQGTRVKQVKIALCNYLKQEKEKIPTSKNRWHCSGDIIESIFGTYKFRKARNSLNGITPYVLVIPLIAAVGHEPKPSGLDFKGNLESVFMTDLTRWKEKKLTENLTIKRRKKLAS
jgi:predicted transcriptional regulator YheO